MSVTALSCMYIDASARMADESLHAPYYPYIHSGPLSTFDHAVIRLDYQVYREVRSVCHSLNRIAWRKLVDVSHTGAEAKPGQLSSYMSKPYVTKKPHVLARHSELCLLTSYRLCRCSWKHRVREGLNYNPYFPGGAIAMTRVLHDDVLEYEDEDGYEDSHYLDWFDRFKWAPIKSRKVVYNPK
ncbi:hypothetical protein G6F57_006673 [Rhizopus arrhizus]|uniref:quinol--cytochrome-c reductase n=1 Tax=Rhizopus oryzae TaxID=64495 RepID=A0A9P7BQD9_RHIOR|nr:hypothetical protein G6F23_009185 [Rhizopus arrhizus]KAG0763154.1 hypothetical protein G6F24_006247 [Rhizopus arrhizus]KAG0811754.1 hypothetical protein G6F20_006914 [Rhizopus arrhizus]KAG0833902.1 hypothetical protein G6F18_006570 [Rhizopus arrhizus]KAG0878989.1 hypothetical protein G6F16_000477 [Rhizopus arrhizus]